MQGSPSHLAGFLQFPRKIAPKRELPFTKVATILVALQMIHGVSVVQSFVKLAAQHVLAPAGIHSRIAFSCIHSKQS